MKRQKKEGLELLPKPPKKLKSKKLSAVQRLGKAMMYTRSLVPDIGMHKVIWVLYPQEIQDRKEWHELVAAYTPKKGIQDGMQGLRIIFRDFPSTLEYSSHLAELSRIQFNFADMSPRAIENALDESVNDESLSDNQRFDAMLQKAMIDSAHGRFDQAYNSFKYMLGHYQKTENHAVQAIIINSVGDIHRRKSEFDDANDVYETATGPAIKSGSATVLHNVVLNLADNDFARKNFSQAEQYYGQVDQLATKMLYADGKIYALNQQAECAIKQDAWDKSVLYWDDVATFCRGSEFFEDLEVALNKLISAKDHLESDKLKAYLEELQQLKEEV